MNSTKTSVPLKVGQVAPMFGVSRATVWRLIYEGDLPHFKIRGSVRIPAAAVEEYLARVLVPAK